MTLTNLNKSRCITECC